MQLSQIYIHPVKSCAGIPLQAALATPQGLLGDRQWMVATAAGEFITGRQFPMLTQVRVELGQHGFRATAPGMEPLDTDSSRFTEPQATAVWKNEFIALAGDDEADFWFSDFLGIACRLLYIGATPTRRVRDNPDIELSFADGYPYLLIGEASLADLNSRLANPVSIRNFRPNLVIAGSTAFAEDSWTHIRIGEVTFEVKKPCERCIFTTVDPDTGKFDPAREPLLTLARYRRTAAGTLFGQNLIARSTGTLRTGDAVEVW